MRLLAIIGILSLTLLLLGCTAEKLTPEQPDAGESVSEPTAAQIESDLNTSPIDQIGSDLDSLILK